MKTKLHLGCGHEILPDHINVDSVKLPGVDVVHDLRSMPWPLEAHRFESILIKHVLEHLPDTIKVMEEIWRVSAPGAVVTIRVPYWNADDFITDPTHIKAFNQFTFDFFDPRHPRCQERPYYSTARFHVSKIRFFVKILGRYIQLDSALFCGVAACLARHFSNVIQVMEIELKAVKA